MALTKVTGQVIKSGTNAVVGIITATKFVGPIETTGDVSAVDGTFTGSVSIAGTLTYADVTNVDSLGIVTARHGFRATAGGINVTAGISTFGGNIDANGTLDVDGDTQLDDLNVAGVATFSALVDANNRIDVVGGANIDQLNVSGVSTIGGVTQITKGTSGGATANTDAALIVDNSSHTYIQFRTPATKEQGLLFGDDADNDVGLIAYSHSTNALTFKTNANPRLVIAADGHVRVGSGDPTYEFELVGAGSQHILIGSTNAAGASLILDGDSNGDGSGTDYATLLHSTAGDLEINNRKNATILFKTGSSEDERLRITSDGDVWHGTQSSTARFAIVGSSAQTSATHVDTNGASLILSNTDTTNNNWQGVEFSDRTDSGDFITGMLSQCTNHSQNYGDLTFWTNSAGGRTEKLRIKSDGKIGIGEDDPDGNYLLIRAASTFQTTKGHIMLTGDSATNGQGPQIVFSESGSGSSYAGAYVGHVRTSTNSVGDLVFGCRATGGDANTVPTEYLRITSGGNIGIGTANPGDYDPGAESLVISGPGGTVGQSGITIVSGSDKYGCIYFGDGTGSASYRGRVEYRHDNDELQFGAAGAHGDLVLDANGDLFLRGDSTCYIVMGSSGDSTQSGANNNMNWIRGNGTNVQYNCAGGFHAWENSGGEKMKLNGANLELTSATQCRLTMGSAGTAGSNDSNWIRGDSNNLMFNCADTSGEHIFECAGTAKARIYAGVGVRAENTCKAWVCYKHDGGTSAIHDDFYVTSVTDEGTGTFSIQFDGDMGGEDKVAYQVGSHNNTPMIVGGIAYTPSYGSQNPWWSMESDWCRIHLQRIDESGSTYIDSEWWNLTAHGDII